MVQQDSDLPGLIWETGGRGNPLQHSCLENPIDREVWRVIVCGVTKNRTQLKRISKHACSHHYTVFADGYKTCYKYLYYIYIYTYIFMYIWLLWCWRRLLRVPWTARRSNQSILKEISPEYPLEGLMLKLKLQYFGHLMWRTDSLEMTLMLEKTKGGRRRGRQKMRWLWVDGHEFE